MIERFTTKNREGFLYSDLYLLLVVVAGFFVWYFKLENVGFVAFAIVASLILFFHDDFAPVIPLALTICFIIPERLSSTDYIYNNMLFYVLAAASFVISLVVFFVRKKRFKLGAQFIGSLVMSITYLLGGILYDFGIWKDGLATTVVFAVMCILVYLVVVNGVKKPDNTYLAKIFTAMAILVMIETFAYFITSEESFKEILIEKLLHLGWGCSNNIGSVLLLGMPLTIYLAVKEKKYVIPCAILVILEFATLVLTLSRGCILIGAIGVPVALIYACIKTQHKKWFYIAFGSTIVLLVLVALLKVEFVEIIWDKLNIFDFGNGTVNDNGRFELYSAGLFNFGFAPINGTGVALSTWSDGVHFTWYHCTPLQFLVNAGILGLLGYIVHLFFKYKIFFVRNTPVVNKFILISIVAWSLYGLIDCNYFLPSQLIMLFVLLAYAEKNLPKNYDTYAIFKRKKGKLQESNSKK